MALDIKTSRLHIREWLVTDAELFLPLSHDPALAGSNFGKLAQESLDDAERRIIEWALAFGQTKMGILPVFLKNQNVQIGVCGIKPLMLKQGLHFEVIGRIASTQSQQGYADEVIPEIMNYAFQKLGLKEVVGISPRESAESQKILENAGMSFLKSVDLQNKKVNIFSVAAQ